MYRVSTIIILSLIFLIAMNESLLCNIHKCNYDSSKEKPKYDLKLNSNKNFMTNSFSCSVTRGIPLPKEEDRGGHVGGIVENTIIVSGGNRWSEDKTQKFFLKSTLIFENQQWIEGPSLPLPMAYSMFSCDDTGLYVAGGTSDGVSMLKDVYVLRSLQKGATWERLPDLPEAIGFGAGVILMGKFYVAGGLLNNGEKTSRMWALDLNNVESGWSESKSIPGVPRYLHAMTVSGDFAYVIGGLAEGTPLTPLNEVFAFNYKENNWSKQNDLSLKGYAWTAQPIDNKHILLTGRADGQIHSDIWVVELNSMKMKKIGSLFIQSTTSPLIKVEDDQWWVVGGEPDSNKNRTKETSIINITDNQYENNNW